MSALPYANKNLGQHFLKDKNVIETITSDFDSLAGSIIEVGPGPAILTTPLSKKGLPFFVVEKDLRFKDNLLTCKKEEEIIFTDALAFDFEKFIKDHGLQKVWLVSNLPYNISAPLFIKFLKIPSITFMTLMFQKEVAQKIAPPTSLKNSKSSLSILGENYFSIKTLIKASPGAFHPPPKVDSLVLSLTRKENPTVPLSEYESFENFLRFIFKAKRKQLQSILKEQIKKDLHPRLAELKIAPEIRAESMSTSEIHSLYQMFKGELR